MLRRVCDGAQIVDHGSFSGRELSGGIHIVGLVDPTGEEHAAALYEYLVVGEYLLPQIDDLVELRRGECLGRIVGMAQLVVYQVEHLVAHQQSHEPFELGRIGIGRHAVCRGFII